RRSILMVGSIDTYTSAAVLQRACERWFKSQFGTRPWLLAREGTLKSFLPDSPIIDVLLFGGFVRQLWDVRLWPKNCEYRLWTLCEGTRDVMIRMMGVAPESVVVIPRYELFPLGKRMRPFPAAGRKWPLVSGGGLDGLKWIELLIR